MDSTQGVIDFSLYLRSKKDASSNGGEESSSNGPSAADQSADKMNTVLDQKNYIEELNRHLK